MSSIAVILEVDGFGFDKHRWTLYPNLLGPNSAQARGGVVQDFDALKRNCLAAGIPFEDSEFPPYNPSYKCPNYAGKPIEWKRPKEITDHPQFSINGFLRFDVKQGWLGDCWLAAAMATLTMNRDLFFQVVAKNQSFEENYAGIFHFKFWRYGEWVDVVIDDRLPTCNGKLLYIVREERVLGSTPGEGVR